MFYTLVSADGEVVAADQPPELIVLRLLDECRDDWCVREIGRHWADHLAHLRLPAHPQPPPTGGKE